jgi:gas vesicle protein
MDDHNHGSRFICVIAGIEMGALAGVLLAPRPGKKTRQTLVGVRKGSLRSDAIEAT